MTVKRVQLIHARKSAGYTQEGFAEAMSVDRSTVVRWEAGRGVPLPYLWPRIIKLLSLRPGELELMLEPNTSDAGPAVRGAKAVRAGFSVISHKFAPVYLRHGTPQLVEKLPTEPAKLRWANCRVAQVALPGIETAGVLYLFDWNVAVLHVREPKEMDSIAHLAVWRRDTHRRTREALSAYLSQLLDATVESRYVLSCFWLESAPWSGRDLETAVRLLCMPRALLGVVEEERNGDLAYAQGVESRLFHEGFAPTDQHNCGVDRVSMGWASWSGVAYHPIHPRAALTEDDLVSCEVLTQALWCLSDEISRQARAGENVSLPPGHGWRWLRSCRAEMTNAAPTEPQQARILRNAVLTTSELPDKLTEAVELLKEVT